MVTLFALYDAFEKFPIIFWLCSVFVDNLSDRFYLVAQAPCCGEQRTAKEMNVQTKGSTCSWEEGHGQPHFQPHFLDVDLKPLLLDEDRDFKLVTSQKEPSGDGKPFKRQLTPVNIVEPQKIVRCLQAAPERPLNRQVRTTVTVLTVTYRSVRKWATAFIPRVLHCLCPIPKCTVPGSKATINEHFVYKGSWIMAGWDADEIDQLPGFVTKDAAHGQIICQVSSFLCWML
eukprot:s348_g21.t2